MRIRYGLGLTGSAIAALMQPAQAETGTWRFHADHVLGTSLDLAVVAKKPLAAALAIDAARAEIARLDKILSAWRSDSELMALNASDWLAVSRELFAVIALCEKMRETTGGAYSARIGRLLEACQDSAHDRARLAVKIETASLRLDAGTRTITRPKDVVFAVDGLAKGFIIDRAIAAARCVPGVDGVMVDIGGDLACWGAAPGGPNNNNKAWRIGLVDPANPADNAPALSHIVLSNQAVATSGPSARGELAVSPLTGARVNHVAYATAVADSAAQADALATAFSVLPPSEALALADRLDNVAARIVTRDGKTFTSSRWQCAATPVLAQTGGAWPAGFGVNIEYEVPKVNAGTYHNPYVAIWITDENRTLIRTLLVLGKETRWKEENYIYWRRFGRNDAKLVDSVSRPTRPPGQYNIKWDGLDDAGKKVPQGKYVLNIEASREKGGHTVQRLELMLNADGAVVEAKPDGEVGKVRATYGRSQ
jgi:thiamine biosynthesis lipoprotein